MLLISTSGDVWGRRLLIASLMVACALVVLLAGQNGALRSDLRQLRARQLIAQPGDVVSEFRAVSLDGDTITVGDVTSGRSQLLLIFDSECQYCLRTLPHWRAIVEKVSGELSSSVHVVGISLDTLPAATRSYAQRYDLPFPIVFFPDARTAGIYKAAGVPITIVVGDGGVVRYARAGALPTPEARDSVVQAVRDPAVRPREGVAAASR